MSKDFRASQIETSKLIASGGISGTTVGLAIYSGSIASNREGVVSDAAIFNDVGTDVFLFVSGSKNLTSFNRENVTLFGGDIVISGTLYAERQVIEVDGQVDGDMIVTGSLFVEPDANSTETVAFRKADGTNIFVIDSTNLQTEMTGRVGINDSTPDAILDIQGVFDSAVPTLLIDHDDATVTGIDINLANTATVGIDIDASNTSGNVLDITADSLTTGEALNISSNSASSLSRSLINVVNDNTSATQTVLLNIKNDAIAGNKTVVIESTAAETNPLLELKNSNTATDKPPKLSFNRSDQTADADDMSLGTIEFRGADDGNNDIPYVSIEAIASDITETDDSGKLTVKVYAGGTDGMAASSDLLSIGGEDVGSGIVPSVTINDAGINCDFRVESNSDTHALFVDASADTVGIGTSAPVNKLDLNGDLGLTGSVRFKEQSAPSAGTNEAVLYAKEDSDTITKLFFKGSNNVEIGPLGSGGSLDDAYDTPDGGGTSSTGAGAIITVDGQPVQLQAGSDVGLAVTGSVEISEYLQVDKGIKRPTSVLVNSGLTYSANQWLKIAQTFKGHDSMDTAFSSFLVVFAGQETNSTYDGDFAYIVNVKVTLSSFSSTPLPYYYSAGTYITVEPLHAGNLEGFDPTTDVQITFDNTSLSSVVELWIKSKETHKQCFVSHLGGTNSFDTSTADPGFEILTGQSWSSSVTSLGTDIFGQYTTKVFNQLIATGSVSINTDGNQVGTYGSDIFFFVSGSEGGKGTGGVSVFGGDVIVSGTLYDGLGNEIGGGSLDDAYDTPSGGGTPSTGIGAIITVDGQPVQLQAGSDVGLAITGSLIMTGSLQVDGDFAVETGHYIYFNGNSGDVNIRSINGDSLRIDGDDEVEIAADSTIQLQAQNNYISMQSSLTEVNENRFDIDFAINTDDFYGTIFVDGNDNTTIIGHEDFDSTPTAAEVPGYGNDVKIMLSGSSGTKDSATRGVVLVPGDMLVSGSLHIGGKGNNNEASIKSGRHPSQTSFTIFEHEIATYNQIRLKNGNNQTQITDGGFAINSDAQDVDLHYFFPGWDYAISGDAGNKTLSFGRYSPTGNDQFFFVSGAIGSKDTAVVGTSVFGGDVVISGSLYDNDGNIISATTNITGTFHVPTPTTIVTTSSVSFSGEKGFNYDPANVGVDTHFFVSGSIGSKDTAVVGTSVFGGDVVISGSLYDASGNIIYGSSLPSVFVNGLSGSLTQLSDGSSYLIAGSNITITSASNGAVTISSTDTNSTYTNGTGLNLAIDAFPNTFSINDSIVATISGSTFSGATKHNLGLSGSLTHLSDGSSYLIAGTNITITSASNGAVTISSSGGGAGNDVDWTDGGDKLFTTSSVSIDTDGNYVETYGSDIFFFVSGSMMTKGTEGISVFGGDLVVSGAIYTGRLAAEDAPNNSYVDLTNTVEIRSGDHVEIRPTNNLDIVTQTGAMYFGNDIIEPKATDVNFFISGSIGGKGASSKTIAAFGGDVYTSGSAYFGSTSIFEGGIHEIYSGSSNPTGVFVHDCDNGHLFYHDSLSTNFTANFTNLNLNQSHATTLTLVLSQSATAYIPNAVQIGGASQTIDWQGNAEPAGTSNGKDVVSFTVVNVAGSYIVLGQLVDFG